MSERKSAIPRGAVGLFLVLVGLVALGNGLSDAVYSNYFKEVYDISAFQRGLIELPREAPGFLCALVIALLAGLGDLKTAMVAQVLACAGLLALGLWTPPFFVMLIFLFVNSLGMHLVMPLQDAIGMSLAEPGQVGRRIGQYSSVKSAVGFLAAILVFFGFRTGFFTFQANTLWVFIVGAIAFFLAIVAAGLLSARVRPVSVPHKKTRLVFRKEYRYYYLLTILHGVQKQIAFVYGTWVIVDLLNRGADTMALLLIVANFLLIFFMRLLGRWMDRFGIKRMMYVDALTFIGVYVLYGFLVMGVTKGALDPNGWASIGIFALFIADRLSMQVGVVKSMYLRAIALSESDVTATLSTGLSLDHVVSILAAMAGGAIWSNFGGHWVFFLAAAFSLGNLFIAYRVQPEKEMEAAREKRRALAAAR